MNIDLKNLPINIDELHQVVCSLAIEKENVASRNSALIREKENITETFSLEKNQWISQNNQLIIENRSLILEKKSLFA
jgi:hypothetical protein